MEGCKNGRSPFTRPRLSGWHAEICISHVVSEAQAKQEKQAPPGERAVDALGR